MLSRILSIAALVMIFASSCTLSNSPAASSGSEIEQLTPALTFTGEVPTNTPQPAAAGASCTIRTDWPAYTVQAGDTVFSIAERSGTDIATLSAANCLENASQLSAGQVFYVPNPIEIARVGDEIPPDHALADPNRYNHIEVYWIVQGDANTAPVGCGDSAVPQMIDPALTGTAAGDITAGINALVNTVGAGAGRGTRGFWNPLSETSLKVDSVTFAGTQVNVALRGDFQLTGVCADAQLEAQIVLTILHHAASEGAQQAHITVNGKNLKQFFDGSGLVTSDFVYTRDLILSQ